MGARCRFAPKRSTRSTLRTPQFATPNLAPTAAAFGTIRTSNQFNYPRRIHIMVKLLF